MKTYDEFCDGLDDEAIAFMLSIQDAAELMNDLESNPRWEELVAAIRKSLPQ